MGLETDRNSVSMLWPKPPKNMVSARFRLRQKRAVKLWFQPKLDNVESETSRNWIGSVSCSDFQSEDVIFQKHWAGLTAWSESSQVHSASPPQLTPYGASRLIIKAGVLCTVLNQTMPYNVSSVSCEFDSATPTIYHSHNNWRPTLVSHALHSQQTFTSIGSAAKLLTVNNWFRLRP